MNIEVLLASLLIIVVVSFATGHAQDLELVFHRELSSPGAHGPCGHLNCKVSGNSDSVNSVTVSVANGNGTSKDLLSVTALTRDVELSGDSIRGSGDFKDNKANMSLDLLQPSLCESGYFICEVVYTTKVGKTGRHFAVAGPNQNRKTPRCHPMSYSNRKLSLSDPCSLQYWLLQKQIDDVKAQQLILSLKEIVRSLELDDDVLKNAGIEDEILDRLSGLEDKVSSLLSTPQSKPSDNATKNFEDLENRVSSLEKALATLQTHDKPDVCERGMGNDLSKLYRPYVVVNDSRIQREVLCDTQTDGGGWIVFQRRANGDEDFYRDWSAYREGFGSLTGDFWLGNEAVHTLTDMHPYELRVDLRFDGEERFARYANFRLENEKDSYRLRLGPRTGTIGWGFSFVNNMPLSTFDRDNDASPDNCAVKTQSSWWFTAQCHAADLNGIWGEKSPRGVCWSPGPGAWLYPTFTEMKIRRVRSTSG